MKTLYIQCSMGAAGDMLMAALLELTEDKEAFLHTINGLGLPNVTVEQMPSTKCGITGTHVAVRIHGVEEEICDAHRHCHEYQDMHEHDHGHDHEHEYPPHGPEHDHAHECHDHHHHHAPHNHNSMDDIAHTLSHLDLPQPVKDHVLAVYHLIAQAESRAHGKPVEQIHFHEVGNLDAIADIVGVCLLLHQLQPDRIVVSPIHVGSGQVRCAHGILPVPAPATAYILQGVPIYSGEIHGELCTPTGAALLKHFAHCFGPMPVMAVDKVGYGMGKKDFPAANCVRVFLGTEADTPADIVELSCNLDDMTGEALGFACETLLQGGALDVFTIPIQMKKSRPAQMLVCLCNPEDSDTIAQLILRHTTTFGVRKTLCQRYVMDRSFSTLQTPYGHIRRKTGTGFGVCKSKLEYEDLAAAARAGGLSLAELCEKLKD